ncbi:MAG TPA: IS630 transposase-related protein [Myxococcaceae bacterium]|nr:IS630 transposase-related protein [Myxococcaceae bacterium]
MARPYSDDLRTRVLAACDAREGTLKEIAARFRIAEATLYNWKHARLHDQRVTAKPRGGGPVATLDESDHNWLREQAASQNDLLLEEYAARLREERGKEVSISTVSRTLIQLGLSRKKRR